MMSGLELPSELIDLIIDHLHDEKPTLKICALVCRDWVAPSRFHLFRSIRLYQNGVGRFISLCDSPLSTIFSAKTSSFLFATNAIAAGAPAVHQRENKSGLNRLLTWRSLDGQKTLATVLPQLGTLILGYIGWWTLSASAKETLAQFESLRELRIRGVVFETRDQFLTLLGTFPNLEVLSMSRCYFRSSEATANSRDPSLNIAHLPRLHTISISDLGDESAAMADAIALLPCHSLRVLDLHIAYISTFELTRGAAIVIGRLVASAGPSLEAFSVKLTYRGDFDTCFELIDLTKNTSLQRISLGIEEDGCVLSILQRLTGPTTSSKSFIPTLQSLDIEDLTTLSIDWETLDMLLQHPYFSALSELRYIVSADFYNEDVIGQRFFTGLPNRRSNARKTMLKNVEDFGARLPLCRARGILRPQECYSWVGGPIHDADGSNWADDAEDSDDAEDAEEADDADDADGVGDANDANSGGDALSE
ncbi:hypothetical protein BOTBODRAFT_192913 [Botryobasidium botryosum FD-172 SS1]|uniref:F-box domain-containing protein n=1 Tax=Botryobasidium botryosum (strain FD-172 SS1) TaxID=930990 RepID=A0A067LUA0_BOTB1|nr:hypothetical protein BOTBODRAFT_192913 [Botryobasidium botryosum FD-172 SS1]